MSIGTLQTFLVMNFQMCPQVGLVREPLVAVVVCAGVGFLPGVDSDVVGEQPGAGEGLLADVALVVPVVGLHVHGQGGHACVELVANCAVLASFCVDLPVSGQVAARGKLLPTVVAALALLRR